MTHLARVRDLALSLPSTTEEPHFQRASFRVRGKVFATADPKEPFLQVFVGEAVRARMLAAHPACLEELSWGRRIVGLRVHLEAAAPGLVEELVLAAWTAKAPESLLRDLPE